MQEYGFIEEGANIPASIYAKGNPAQMREIYEFMNSIGLLPGLKSSMTLFIRPIDNIKENVNLLIEHGLFEDFIDNVSVLGLSPQTVEKRIVYLESIGEKISIPILKLNNSDFYSQFKINERDLNKIKEKPLSQTIIENKYANYIYNDAKFLNLEGLKAVNDIYKQIEELGVVNKNLEYVKKEYSYSIIKIKENIHKIISNMSEYNNISFIDMTEIFTMAILGNKKVDEKEINDIRESIKIREIEVLENKNAQQILEVPKIEVVDKEIKEEVNNEISQDQIKISNIFENPEVVDGVSIDELESIDDFDRYSGVKKEKLIFPEDEYLENNEPLENQIEMNFSKDIEAVEEMIEEDINTKIDEEINKEINKEANEEVNEEVKLNDEDAKELTDKEKKISEMRAQIQDMNKTLQTIRLKKEEEKLKKQKEELEKQIRAELEKEISEKLKEIEEEKRIIEEEKQTIENIKLEKQISKQGGIKLVEDEKENNETEIEFKDEEEVDSKEGKRYIIESNEEEDEENDEVENKDEIEEIELEPKEEKKIEPT